MSIQPVATTATTATASVDGTSRRHHHSPFAAAATALGMSERDVREAVRGGQSLDDLATAKGVSHDALIAALKAGAPKDLANSPDATARLEALAAHKVLGRSDGPPPATATDASSAATATSAVTGTSSTSGTSATGAVQGHHRHHHHHGGGDTTGVAGNSLSSDQSQMADALASLLGTDSTTLVNQLRSGADLNSMLKDKNVDPSKLADVISKGFMIDASA